MRCRPVWKKYRENYINTNIKQVNETLQAILVFIVINNYILAFVEDHLEVFVTTVRLYVTTVRQKT